MVLPWRPYTGWRREPLGSCCLSGPPTARYGRDSTLHPLYELTARILGNNEDASGWTWHLAREDFCVVLVRRDPNTGEEERIVANGDRAKRYATSSPPSSGPTSTRSACSAPCTPPSASLRERGPERSGDRRAEEGLAPTVAAAGGGVLRTPLFVAWTPRQRNVVACCSASNGPRTAHPRQRPVAEAREEARRQDRFASRARGQLAQLLQETPDVVSLFANMLKSKAGTEPWRRGSITVVSLRPHSGGGSRVHGLGSRPKSKVQRGNYGRALSGWAPRLRENQRERSNTLTRNAVAAMRFKANESLDDPWKQFEKRFQEAGDIEGGGSPRRAPMAGERLEGRPSGEHDVRQEAEAKKRQSFKPPAVQQPHRLLPSTLTCSGRPSSTSS